MSSGRGSAEHRRFLNSIGDFDRPTVAAIGVKAVTELMKTIGGPLPPPWRWRERRREINWRQGLENTIERCTEVLSA